MRSGARKELLGPWAGLAAGGEERRGGGGKSNDACNYSASHDTVLGGGGGGTKKVVSLSLSLSREIDTLRSQRGAGRRGDYLEFYY